MEKHVSYDNRRIAGQIKKFIGEKDIKMLEVYIESLISVKEFDRKTLVKSTKILLKNLDKFSNLKPELFNIIMKLKAEVELEVFKKQIVTEIASDELIEVNKDLNKKLKETKKELKARMDHAEKEYKKIAEVIEYEVELDCGLFSTNLLLQIAAGDSSAKSRLIAWHRNMDTAMAKAGFDKTKFYKNCIIEFAGCIHTNHDTHNLHKTMLDKLQDVTGINDKYFNCRTNIDGFTRSRNVNDQKTIIRVIRKGL